MFKSFALMSAVLVFGFFLTQSVNADNGYSVSNTGYKNLLAKQQVFVQSGSNYGVLSNQVYKGAGLYNNSANVYGSNAYNSCGSSSYGSNIGFNNYGGAYNSNLYGGAGYLSSYGSHRNIATIVVNNNKHAYNGFNNQVIVKQFVPIQQIRFVEVPGLKIQKNVVIQNHKHNGYGY